MHFTTITLALAITRISASHPAARSLEVRQLPDLSGLAIIGPTLNGVTSALNPLLGNITDLTKTILADPVNNTIPATQSFVTNLGETIKQLLGAATKFQGVVTTLPFPLPVTQPLQGRQVPDLGSLLNGTQSLVGVFTQIQTALQDTIDAVTSQELAFSDQEQQLLAQLLPQLATSAQAVSTPLSILGSGLDSLGPVALGTLLQTAFSGLDNALSGLLSTIENIKLS